MGASRPSTASSQLAGCDFVPWLRTVSISPNDRKVQATRRRLGLTSRELADRVQADPGVITRWEAGGVIRKECHQEAFSGLCELLGLSES